MSPRKPRICTSLSNSLPDKYETIVGESGARLSSGQAQRLALARAFLKDAPILILDEPTSSLDPETESLLEESTRKLMKGRTVLTIAHRLNTIFQSDQIIVLDSGRVIEQGTHRELLANNNIYASMVKTYEVIEDKEVRIKKKKEIITAQPKTTSHLSLLPSQTFKPQNTFFRLMQFLKGNWGRVALSVLIGSATIGSSVALMGTSAWLISTAALHPSVADLGVSVVGVRFFGITRGIFRYLERLVSHDVTFRLLSRLRVWFYEKLEPLAPARLMEFHAGDLLARIIGDVETLENFYVRVVSPPLTAIIVGIFTSIFLASFYPILAPVFLIFFLSLGILLPALAQIISRKPAEQTITLRSDLHTQLVDGIQGMADLLAYGRANERLNSNLIHWHRLRQRPTPHGASDSLPSRLIYSAHKSRPVDNFISLHSTSGVRQPCWPDAGFINLAHFRLLRSCHPASSRRPNVEFLTRSCATII